MQITDAAEQKSVMVGFLDLFYILYKVQILRCFFFFNGLTEINKDQHHNGLERWNDQANKFFVTCIQMHLCAIVFTDINGI